LSEKVSRDQESNSFAYARTGAATVIRQKNLSPNILIFEIDRVFKEDGLREKMIAATKEFFKPDAEVKIAEAILDIAIEHTK
jgi:UDP-N-acetylglucosamine:LPS N-acetylglucosamine transferase